MSTDDMYSEVRQADPAAGLDRDPDGAAARHLLSRIRATSDPARPRRRRKRTVAVLAAAAMAISTGAVASGLFEPDPQDLDTIVTEASEHADVHLPGWRPSLRAETVWCFYDRSTYANTPVSEFPLDEALTRDRIATECSSGNDMVRSGQGAASEDLTFCSATIPEEAYLRRVEERREPVLAGDVSKASALVPIVLGWQADCEQVDLDVDPPMSLSPLDQADIDRINRVREAEVTFRATAMQQCIPYDEAIQTAAQARQSLDGEWPLIEGPDGDGSAECHQLWIDEWGLLSLQGRTEPEPAG